MIKTTNTFLIKHTSDEDGQTYDGTFTCRRQSVMDISRIKVRKAQLNGGLYCVLDANGSPTGQGIDFETDILNHMLATLETVLIQKPDWWDLAKITDFDLISKVFGEVMSFENSFRGRGGKDLSSGQSSQNNKEDSTKESASADTSNLPKKVVGKEVQAALDP